VNKLNSQGWRQKFEFLLVLSDFIVIFCSGFFAFWSRNTQDLAFRVDIKFDSSFWISYQFALILFSIAWLIFLSLLQTRGKKLIGAGAKEYGAVAQASLFTFALSIFALYLFNASFSRQILFSYFFVGTIGLVITRWLWRRRLNRLRRDFGWKDNVILVGELSTVEELGSELESRYQTGLSPAGVCLTDKHLSLPTLLSFGEKKVPVFGNLKSVRNALDATGSSSVIITDRSNVGPAEIKDISWSLDPDRHELILAQGIVDVSGPRIHTRPLAGLPFMYVEVPNFQGAKRVTKRLIDLVGSSIGIVLLLVPGLFIAAAIKLNGKGPVFFVQERVGRNNSHFKMYKFRSMNPDAESQKDKIVSSSDTTSPLFKLADDPRITPIGKFLRKWSIDELPQLLNVFIGNMSLVGPRPPLQSEVDQYEDHVNRKFMVKPGITGLWQVSGRSNLSWEDSVRLDLYYVENWSITTDIIIMFRTIISVIKRDGAY
jgi:exopolysaccharide biosynthesis polyprenyl glycosylphosphotransferase